MKESRYIFIILFLCWLTPAQVYATDMQSGLDIEGIFHKYGKKKNVTMVELSNEMLDTYGMTHYKSITIKNDAQALADIRYSLEKDQEGARKIKEVTDDGGIISAYYQLPGSNSYLNRFILFKLSTKGVITLIYIEGELDSDDLITLLFTAKDL